MYSKRKVNIMDSKRPVCQVFNSNAQGRRIRGRPKTDGGTLNTQVLIDAKLIPGKEGKNVADWVKSINPLTQNDL
jgi:hypothetical protein